MIVLTNDDGYNSIGLTTLARTMKSLGFADISIVAPAEDVSGCGGALSLHKPIKVQRCETNVYKVYGTAADAAYIAVNGLFPHGTVEMVVSGINIGENYSDDMFSSGTLGAAFQGRFLPKMSMAFSMAGNAEMILNGAHCASQIVKHYYGHTKKHLPDGVVLNINIPDLYINAIRGIKATVAVKRGRPTPCKIYKDCSLGDGVYEIGQRGDTIGNYHETDFHAVESGFISVNPVSLDLTSIADFRTVEKMCSEISFNYKEPKQ